MDAAPRRWRRWLRGPLISLATLLVAALAVEGLSRALGLAAPPQPYHEGSAVTRPSPDEVLRFEPVPGAQRRQVYPALDGGPPRVASISINDLGWRGPPFSATPRPGTLRIACVGDSYTFGDGVSDDETWPWLLQQRLDPRAERLEVLNLGVNGYETEQEVRLLETRVLSLQPDLVLLTFFLNDGAIRSRGGGQDAGQLAPTPLYRFLTGEGWFGSLRSVSRFVDWWADGLARHEYLRHFGASLSLLYDDDSPGWSHCRKQLRKAKRMLEERGIPLRVLLYPLLFRTGDTLVSHDAYARVSAFLEGEGIGHLDLEPVMLAADVDRLRVHPSNTHPNGAGHALAAEAIEGYLRAEGLLPGAGAGAAGR